MSRRASVPSALIERLPEMAWLCLMDTSTDEVLLYHGRGVERVDGGFFEGAWDGSFGDGAFETSINLFGSGGKRLAEGMLFTPPSHTLDGLYSFATGTRVGISNSVAFLTAHFDIDWSRHPFSDANLFTSIVDGLEGFPRTVRIGDGRFSIHYHHNFIVHRNGLVTTLPKGLPPRFPDFDSYYDYLRGTVRRVCANAADERRAERYAPLTTLSSGYDSSCCSVLARDAGCTEAVAFTTARGQEPDAGVTVAGALGLDLRYFERPGHLSGSNGEEAEFLGNGMQGEDVVYRALEGVLAGRLLFTGFHGDKVWDRHAVPSEYIKRGDVSGSSLAEFRLRVGFVDMPVPFIGCQRHADLVAISNSAEMRRFSVGGLYDRPIPRRIVESAGVPRAAFGQRKRAVSLLLSGQTSRLSVAARSEIEALRRSTLQDLDRALSYHGRAARYRSGRLVWRGLGALRRLLSAISPAHSPFSHRLRDRCFKALCHSTPAAFGYSHPRHVLVFRWAVGTLARRYALDQPEARRA